MKENLTIKFLFFFCLMLITHLKAQEQLIVEGNAIINGQLEINADNDTSSIYVGRNVKKPSGSPTYYNTVVGVNAGRYTTSNFGNAFFGFEAGASNNGNTNSFYGYEAGKMNDGTDNAFFGSHAGLMNKGTSNAFFGYRAGQVNDNSLNAFFGFESGKKNTTGEYNAFFGAETGSSHTIGSFNTYLGYFAGGGITEGSKNTYIGNEATGSSSAISESIAIGHNSEVGCSNCAVIGGTSDDAVKVGIGVKSPSGHLEVYGASGVSTPHVLLTESVGDYARLRWKNTTNPNTYWDIAGRTNSPGSPAGAELNFFYNEGSLNVLKLFGDGDATLAGDLTENSDMRLKQNILQIQDVLDQLLLLKGYSYNWKNRSTKKRHIGLLAQEVQEIFPELVRENDKGILSVSYTHFVPILIESIKDQQALINNQQVELAKQQSQIVDLQKQMHYLLSIINNKK